MTRISIVAAALCLAACGAGQAQWVNANAKADYDNDRHACGAQAEALSLPSYDPRRMAMVADPMETQRLTDQCMFAHGWHLEARPGGK